jgi:hypothetical protein
MGNTKYKHTKTGDIAMRRLLVAVFVISALFAVSNVYAGELSVTKCTVTAGKTEGYDTIVVSGEMNAAADDLSGADNIQVTVDSEDIVSPCVQSFPIDETTLKNGKYKCSRTENSSKTSFTFDTKTSKFSFTARNVDLLGLGCPLTIGIEIGDYNAETEVGEAIVNGPKSPIPIKLMMGIKNVLRVDSYKVTQGTKLNSDQLTVKGGFAVEDTDANMTDWVSENLVVTLDTQKFTIPKNDLKAGKGKFGCSKADVNEGGTADATFDFATCSFAITIKNTEIEADAGGADFGLEFGDFNATQMLCTFTISPTAQSFTASVGAGSVAVTTSNGCAWTATSNAGWITITSGSSGSGNGTVGYSVVANGGAKHTGTMTIAGQTFTVTQAQSASAPIKFVLPKPLDPVKRCSYFSYQIGTITGGVGPPYTVTLCTMGGFPPLDIFVNAGGLIEGVASSPEGTYSFEVCVTDAAFNLTSKSTSIKVTPPISPGTPSGPSPANGATGVSTSPTLTWTETSNTQSYNVYFGTASPPPLIMNVPLPASYKPATALNSNTTYYWQVIAEHDMCPLSPPTLAGGPVWSFKTTASTALSLTVDSATCVQSSSCDPSGGCFLTMSFAGSACGPVGALLSGATNCGSWHTTGGGCKRLASDPSCTDWSYSLSYSQSYEVTSYPYTVTFYLNADGYEQISIPSTVTVSPCACP